ncbi:MAG: hypothetical protein GY858_03810, partial [Candidatus Omnitrophica bacterium]|nr:hypothetical protein [Candidatus Omnitrophota bacterium]
EKANAGFILEASLKVMHQRDYVARGHVPEVPLSEARRESVRVPGSIDQIASQVFTETILPEINHEVNHGKNFATLRQIYHSLVLATWFRKKFKNTFYKHYIDQGKISGIDLEDKGAKDTIYNLYVEAYRQGVYDYIKRERDPKTNKPINRRYYSGGTDFGEKAFAKMRIVPEGGLPDQTSTVSAFCTGSAVLTGSELEIKSSSDQEEITSFNSGIPLPVGDDFGDSRKGARRVVEALLMSIIAGLVYVNVNLLDGLEYLGSEEEEGSQAEVEQVGKPGSDSDGDLEEDNDAGRKKLLAHHIRRAADKYEAAKIDNDLVKEYIAETSKTIHEDDSFDDYLGLAERYLSDVSDEEKRAEIIRHLFRAIPKRYNLLSGAAGRGYAKLKVHGLIKRYISNGVLSGSLSLEFIMQNLEYKPFLIQEKTVEPMLTPNVFSVESINNISCGTMDNHKEMNRQLETAFDQLREALGVSGDLTETQADEALRLLGYLHKGENLEQWRMQIRNQAKKEGIDIPDDIPIFFSVPEGGGELFYDDQGDYAAGHYSADHNRIHISLPFTRNRGLGMDAAAGVGAHELFHIQDPQHRHAPIPEDLQANLNAAVEVDQGVDSKTSIDKESREGFERELLSLSQSKNLESARLEWELYKIEYLSSAGKCRFNHAIRWRLTFRNTKTAKILGDLGPEEVSETLQLTERSEVARFKREHQRHQRELNALKRFSLVMGTEQQGRLLELEEDGGFTEDKNKAVALLREQLKPLIKEYQEIEELLKILNMRRLHQRYFEPGDANILVQVQEKLSEDVISAPLSDEERGVVERLLTKLKDFQTILVHSGLSWAKGQKPKESDLLAEEALNIENASLANHYLATLYGDQIRKGDCQVIDYGSGRSGFYSRVISSGQIPGSSRIIDVDLEGSGIIDGANPNKTIIGKDGNMIVAQPPELDDMPYNDPQRDGTCDLIVSNFALDQLDKLGPAQVKDFFIMAHRLLKIDGKAAIALPRTKFPTAKLITALRSMGWDVVANSPKNGSFSSARLAQISSDEGKETAGSLKVWVERDFHLVILRKTSVKYNPEDIDTNNFTLNKPRTRAKGSGEKIEVSLDLDRINALAILAFEIDYADIYIDEEEYIDRESLIEANKNIASVIFEAATILPLLNKKDRKEAENLISEWMSAQRHFPANFVGKILAITRKLNGNISVAIIKKKMPEVEDWIAVDKNRWLQEWNKWHLGSANTLTPSELAALKAEYLKRIWIDRKISVPPNFELSGEQVLYLKEYSRLRKLSELAKLPNFSSKGHIYNKVGTWCRGNLEFAVAFFMIKQDTARVTEEKDVEEKKKFLDLYSKYRGNISAVATHYDWSDDTIRHRVESWGMEDEFFREKIKDMDREIEGSLDEREEKYIRLYDRYRGGYKDMGSDPELRISGQSVRTYVLRRIDASALFAKKIALLDVAINESLTPKQEQYLALLRKHERSIKLVAQELEKSRHHINTQLKTWREGSAKFKKEWDAIGRPKLSPLQIEYLALYDKNDGVQTAIAFALDVGDGAVSQNISNWKEKNATFAIGLDRIDERLRESDRKDQRRFMENYEAFHGNHAQTAKSLDVKYKTLEARVKSWEKRYPDFRNDFAELKKKLQGKLSDQQLRFIKLYPEHGGITKKCAQALGFSTQPELAVAVLHWQRDNAQFRLEYAKITGNPSNISCGTMDNHKEMNRQLETAFDQLREVLEVSGDLTQDQADQALKLAGYLQDGDDLSAWRKKIRKLANIPDDIPIFFSVPEGGGELFYDDQGGYAAGHYSVDHNRIHISLPFTRNRGLGMDAAAGVGAHELFHIQDSGHRHAPIPEDLQANLDAAQEADQAIKKTQIPSSDESKKEMVKRLVVLEQNVLTEIEEHPFYKGSKKVRTSSAYEEFIFSNNPQFIRQKHTMKFWEFQKAIVKTIASLFRDVWIQIKNKNFKTIPFLGGIVLAYFGIAILQMRVANVRNIMTDDGLVGFNYAFKNKPLPTYWLGNFVLQLLAQVLLNFLWVSDDGIALDHVLVTALAQGAALYIFLEAYSFASHELTHMYQDMIVSKAIKELKLPFTHEELSNELGNYVLERPLLRIMKRPPTENQLKDIVKVLFSGIRRVVELKTNAPNISCGTMDNHKEMNRQLETAFDQLREVLGVSGDLTQDQADQALKLAGYLQDGDDLSAWRNEIRKLANIPDDIPIFFSVPEGGGELFYDDQGDYAAGHYSANENHRRTHVSLPFARNRKLGMNGAAGVVEHEWGHIEHGSHEKISEELQANLDAAREADQVREEKREQASFSDHVDVENDTATTNSGRKWQIRKEQSFLYDGRLLLSALVAVVMAVPASLLLVIHRVSQMPPSIFRTALKVVLAAGCVVYFFNFVHNSIKEHHRDFTIDYNASVTLVDSKGNKFKYFGPAMDVHGGGQPYLKIETTTGMVMADREINRLADQGVKNILLLGCNPANADIGKVKIPTIYAVSCTLPLSSVATVVGLGGRISKKGKISNCTSWARKWMMVLPSGEKIELSEVIDSENEDGSVHSNRGKITSFNSGVPLPVGGDSEDFRKGARRKDKPISTGLKIAVGALLAGVGLIIYLLINFANESAKKVFSVDAGGGAAAQKDPYDASDKTDDETLANKLENVSQHRRHGDDISANHLKKYQAWLAADVDEYLHQKALHNICQDIEGINDSQRFPLIKQIISRYLEVIPDDYSTEGYQYLSRDFFRSLSKCLPYLESADQEELIDILDDLASRSSVELLGVVDDWLPYFPENSQKLFLDTFIEELSGNEVLYSGAYFMKYLSEDEKFPVFSRAIRENPVSGIYNTRHFLQYFNEEEKVKAVNELIANLFDEMKFKGQILHLSMPDILEKTIQGVYGDIGPISEDNKMLLLQAIDRLRSDIKNQEISSNEAGGPVSSIASTNPPNISCGTMDNHKEMNRQLETAFDQLREALGVSGDLTQDQADQALKLAGYLQDGDDLNAWREEIRKLAGIPDDIQIFFSVPEGGGELFYDDQGGYAAGHYSVDHNRIHISLPFTRNRGLGMDAAAGVGAHELFHIQDPGHRHAPIPEDLQANLNAAQEADQEEIRQRVERAVNRAHRRHGFTSDEREVFRRRAKECFGGKDGIWDTHLYKKDSGELGMPDKNDMYHRSRSKRHYPKEVIIEKRNKLRRRGFTDREILALMDYGAEGVKKKKKRKRTVNSISSPNTDQKSAIDAAKDYSVADGGGVSRRDFIFSIGAGAATVLLPGDETKTAQNNNTSGDKVFFMEGVGHDASLITNKISELIHNMDKTYLSEIENNPQLQERIKEALLEKLTQDKRIIADFKRQAATIKEYIRSSHNIELIGMEASEEKLQWMRSKLKGRVNYFERLFHIIGLSERFEDFSRLYCMSPETYLYISGYEPLKNGEVKLVGLESEKLMKKGIAIYRELAQILIPLKARADSRQSPEDVETFKLIAPLQDEMERTRSKLDPKDPILQRINSSDIDGIKELSAKIIRLDLATFACSLERDNFAARKLLSLKGKNILVSRGHGHFKSTINLLKQFAPGEKTIIKVDRAGNSSVSSDDGDIHHSETITVKGKYAQEAKKVVKIDGREVEFYPKFTEKQWGSKEEAHRQLGIFAQQLKEAGVATEREIDFGDGVKRRVVIDDDFGLGNDQLQAMVQEATLRRGCDISRLPKLLVITYLDQSYRLGEDHVGNGFIGVNRAIGEIKDDTARVITLKMVLVHEFSHELRGKLNAEEMAEFEKQQLMDDARYTLESIAQMQGVGQITYQRLQRLLIHHLALVRDGADEVVLDFDQFISALYYQKLVEDTLSVVGEGFSVYDFDSYFGALPDVEGLMHLGAGRESNVYGVNAKEFLKMCKVPLMEKADNDRVEMILREFGGYVWMEKMGIYDELEALGEDGAIIPRLNAAGSKKGVFGMQLEAMAEKDFQPFDEVDLTLVEQLDVLIKVSNTMAVIHAKDGQHNDLNPKNILVRKKDGKIEVILIDFLFSRSDTYISKSFSMAWYKAPENYRCSVSDVYSLASIINSHILYSTANNFESLEFKALEKLIDGIINAPINSSWTQARKAEIMAHRNPNNMIDFAKRLKEIKNLINPPHQTSSGDEPGSSATGGIDVTVGSFNLETVGEGLDVNVNRPLPAGGHTGPPLHDGDFDTLEFKITFMSDISPDVLIDDLAVKVYR